MGCELVVNHTRTWPVFTSASDRMVCRQLHDQCYGIMISTDFLPFSARFSNTFGLYTDPLLCQTFKPVREFWYFGKRPSGSHPVNRLTI